MNYQRTSFGFGGPLPPAIKNILFANAIIWIVSWLNPGIFKTLYYYFALNAYDVFYRFQIWELVTYLFLHGDFFHVFFNMLLFWMFGSELEIAWGAREFVKYYFICGIGAGLINILLTPADPMYSGTIGASGAVYGILLAFAMRNPNREVFLLFFPIPVKVKYMVGFLTLVAFFSTWSSQGDNIAHAAHLGGIVVGFVYLKYWGQIYKVKSFFKSQTENKKKYTYTSADEEKVEYYRRKIDELLDKINKVGYLNLTDEEKELLEEGSKYLREHDNTDYN